MSAISLLCEGVVDWGAVKEGCQSYTVGAAGALFGAAWWIEADAFIVQRVKGEGPAVPALFLLPGLLATVAIVMINCVRREDLTDSDALEEGAECRIKFWLFLSYCLAFGSIFGAVWLLFQCHQDADKNLWAGVTGVVQCFMIVASGLIMWLLRPAADSAWGGMY